MAQAENAAQLTLPTIEIGPARGWSSLGLRDVWEYRELLYFLVSRNVRGAYRQMAFGVLWIVMRPLVNMVLYSVIFGNLAKLPSDGLPYPIFAYSALLPWTFFAGAVRQVANSLVANKGLISKVYFPRLIVPLAGVLAGLIDFAVSFVILLGMMAYYGIWPTWSMLTVPLYMLLTAVLALGIGLWFASWIVHYRDVSDVLSYLLSGWMYASPVVYAASVIPEQWRVLYRLNPMTSVIEGLRWALFGTGQPPDVFLLISVLVAVLLMIFGAFYFRRTERTIVDVI